MTDHVTQPQAKEVGTAQAEMSSTGSCSGVNSGEEPSQSEQQVQQSSPAVESQKEECEHEQYPEKSSTESDRDGGNGSGDDGENGRDKSVISLDTIMLE